MVILPHPLIQNEQLSVDGEIKISTAKLHPGGLTRNIVLRITDHCDMTSVVYR